MKVSEVKALFDRLAGVYDNPSQRFYPFAADRLVDRLGLRPGMKVLDACTGTGVLATSAAQKVPGGRVLAVDVSDPMLDRAEFNRRKMALANIDLFDMDAAAPEFRAGYFDAVACAFGLFYLDDMAAALSAWHRLLAPGGRVGFSSFTGKAMQPMADGLHAALAAAGVESPAPIWHRLSDPAGCEALLADAGFEQFQVETVQLGYHLARAEDWWEVATCSGLFPALDTLGAARLDALRDAHLAEVSARVTEDGLWVDIETVLATGVKG